MAGLSAILDRDGTAGTAAVPCWCGRTRVLLVLRVAQRCVTSLGTLLFLGMKAPDGSDWTVARTTEWSVRLALATSCAEACAESALFPTRLHAKSEPSVTISSHVHLQLA